MRQISPSGKALPPSGKALSARSPWTAPHPPAGRVRFKAIRALLNTQPTVSRVVRTLLLKGGRYTRREGASRGAGTATRPKRTTLERFFVALARYGFATRHEHWHALARHLARWAAFMLLVAPLGLNLAAAKQVTAWESGDSIRQVVEQFVRSRLPEASRDARITVQGPAAGLHFPRCARLQAQNFGAANPFGAQTVEVSCAAPQAWSLYLPVQVAMPQGAVVAARALSAGHVLVEADLAVVQRDLASLPSGALTAPASAIGQVLQYSVAAGQSITQSMLAGPQLVHDGQSVALVAQGQGVRLVALGKAMENGRQGETILARNVQSGRVVSGVVDASGQILVAMQP